MRMLSMGMHLAGLTALAAAVNEPISMTIPRHYGKSRYVKRAGKVPNAYFGRWIPRKDKQHRLKGVRP